MKANRIVKAMLVALILCAGVAPSALAAQPGASFTGLGDLAGGQSWSEALGVSADGKVAAGASVSAQGTEAISWTATGGLVGLGLMPSGRQTWAYGISPDGSSIVGHTDPVEEAFLWTQSQGYVMLGYLSSGHTYSCARAVSNSGSVVVGESGPIKLTIGLEAFRWTQATGMVSLGSLGGGNSTAGDVSADGTVIVGQGLSSSGYEAYRWTQATGMLGLGDLPGGAFYSTAYGVSDDGKIVVGYGTSTLGQEAFRWAAAGGMVGLGDLAGGAFESTAMDVSADGSVIVGYGTSASGKEAFVWDAAHGMRSLKGILVSEYGLDLTGWTLIDAWGVSADGKTIAGYGRDPAGNIEGWVATTPEPATLSLLAVGGLMALRRHR
jgi:probable HAF family extracellular repeat protein